MLTVDDFGRIRRAYRDGMSIREMARKFGHSRRSVRKALGQAEPAPYTLHKPRVAPKLGPFHAVIDQIRAEDEQAPRKQRHTAMQIYRRLVAPEYGYTGGYDQIRRYVGRKAKDHRQTFIPLSHEAGESRRAGRSRLRSHLRGLSRGSSSHAGAADHVVLLARQVRHGDADRTDRGDPGRSGGGI